ncbi:hypothetical protein ES708_26435 [subsurface metagenome]
MLLNLAINNIIYIVVIDYIIKLSFHIGNSLNFFLIIFLLRNYLKWLGILNTFRTKYYYQIIELLPQIEALKEEYDLFEWRNIFYNDGIVFTVDDDIFPGSWYEPDINARAESLAEDEIERSKKIAIYALNKYPVKVLKENLGKLYILKSMNFYGVDYGGTNDEKYRVYITSNGIDMGYTALFIEKEFHHEFSSILFKKFEESEWRQINPADFVYFDEQTGGSGAIREGRASQEFDTKMHEAGFLYEYAQSTLENDFNSFAENIFVNDGDLFKLVEEYEKLSLKLDLIVDFYSSINPRFTLEYFKGISLLEK